MPESTSIPRKITGQLTVNGITRTINTYESDSLLDVIRFHFGLTGAKRGCDIGTCGTCTVLVDGKARKSCSQSVQLLLDTDAAITTVEGLGSQTELEPLQRAFINYGAVQCGYCTPGLLMASRALLERNPNPSTNDINQMMRGQLCRCTGYQPIVDAIQAVAHGQADKVAKAPTIGHSCSRSDADDKVRGTCKYTPDLWDEQTLHAVVVRSSRPHASLEAIDASATLALDGVLRVLTHEDVPGKLCYGNAIPDMPSLCRDKVRFVGDAIAIVIAKDPLLARLGAEKVTITYGDLPAVTDAERALDEYAPAIHPHGNLASEQFLRKGMRKARCPPPTRS